MKNYFDEITEYIIWFGVRIMAGDFNMSLWMAVVELRARGLQANFASWYPFRCVSDEKVRMDTRAIIVIGGCMGCRLIYDCSVLGNYAPARTNSWRNVEEVERDEDGKEISRGPWPVQDFFFKETERVTGEFLR